MFIATRAADSAKLRRSGIHLRALDHGRRCLASIFRLHAAATELGRASCVVVTINLALLAELDQRPSPRKGAGATHPHANSRVDTCRK
jgi:hypothetical protein